jgi:hypothetical protein
MTPIRWTWSTDKLFILKLYDSTFLFQSFLYGCDTWKLILGTACSTVRQHRWTLELERKGCFVAQQWTDSDSFSHMGINTVTQFNTLLEKTQQLSWSLQWWVGCTCPTAWHCSVEDECYSQWLWRCKKFLLVVEQLQMHGNTHGKCI